MVTKGEETSERKRLSIPKVDQSSLEWWAAQHDVGLSVRMLIRAEIERNGYADVAFQPVAQLPRRGRPPGQTEVSDEAPEPVQQASAVRTLPAPTPTHVSIPDPSPAPQLVAAGGFDPIDAIMNG